MRRSLTILIVLVVVALSTTPALAQRGRMHGGKVYTPYGLAYDTNSPEWRMAGGNIDVYRQIMAQKAYMQQLQQEQKLQKRMLAQQKAQQKAFEAWAKANPEAFMQMQAQQQLEQRMMATRRNRGTRRQR